MPMGLPSTRMSASEYLAWERLQEERHEFRRGEIVTVPPSTFRHSALLTAIGAELHRASHDRGCLAFAANLRVAIVPGEYYVYPDVGLVCRPYELEEGTDDVLLNPQAIIEVLSRSTEAYDRGDKWAGYRRIASLREYVLVSQSLPRIEIYRREGDGWRYEVVEAGERLTVAGEFGLEVDAIYDGMFELPGD